MKAQKQPGNIYISKRGITLVDGYYIARNPRLRRVAIISIANGVVGVHDVARQMTLSDLVNLDGAGYLDVYGVLKLIEPKKEKK